MAHHRDWPWQPTDVPHEPVRVFADLLPDARMLLQVSLQFRMLGDELLVVHERWIFAELLGGLGMAVEEVIHIA